MIKPDGNGPWVRYEDHVAEVNLVHAREKIRLANIHDLIQRLVEPLDERTEDTNVARYLVTMLRNELAEISGGRVTFPKGRLKSWPPSLENLEDPK